MSENDVIKMNTDTKLTDSKGTPINVTTPKPEYLVETFSLRESENDSEIITGDK